MHHEQVQPPTISNGDVPRGNRDNVLSHMGWKGKGDKMTQSMRQEIKDLAREALVNYSEQ